MSDDPRMTDPRLANTVVTDGKLGFVAIPKNASSSLIDAFHSLDWKRKDPGQVECFAVLRDPVERWISGFTQTFYRNKEGVLQEVYRDITPFVEETWYDLHQAPQILFLKKWEDLTLFKLESLPELKEWLAKRNVVLPEIGHLNTRDKQPIKREFNDWVDNALTEVHRKYLREYYAEDLELYNSAI